MEAGYFHIVAYYGGVTPAVDAALGRALADSKLYYLAAQINLNNPLAPGEYFVWVKGHPAKPSGVFVHASSKYQDLGTKLRELAPEPGSGLSPDRAPRRRRPQFVKTRTYCTAIVPPEEVWLVGVEQRHCSSGNAPPMPTSSRIE